LSDGRDGRVNIRDSSVGNGQQTQAELLALILDERRLRLIDEDQIGAQRDQLLKLGIGPSSHGRELAYGGRIRCVLRHAYELIERPHAIDYFS
jgi:hypothetical protein